MAGTNLKKTKQGYGYKYTELAQIHDYLESIGAEYYQYIGTEDGNDYIYTVPIIDGEEKPARRGCRVINATLSGKSNPAQEQGSALTYARRYSLLMAFGLATEDDDGEALTRTEEQKTTSRKTANKDKNPQAPEGEVKPEEEMTKPGDIITPAHVKAVRARIETAAKKGKNLDEPALCKMLKIESFEQMNYGQLNWFNNMMEKNGL